MSSKGGVKPEKTALEVAVGMLARREHSRAELAQKLRQKGFVVAEIEAALEGLVARNYLNDGRFALVRAGYRANQSKWGPVKIRQELAARGVKGEVLSEAMAEVESMREGQWLVTARGLLARKFREPLVVAEVEDDGLGRREARDAYNKEKAKRLSFLLRRGFTMGQALAALDASMEGGVDE